MGNIEEKYMAIGIAEGKSFEEVRVADYLKAYRTTGRAPKPVPQNPISDLERAALNLPPLFKPFLAPSATDSLTTALSKSAIINPVDLPIAQELRPHKVEGECYQSISCMTEYSAFCHEELRFYAYSRGNRLPPPTVKLDPFVASAVTASTRPTQPSSPSADSPDSLQSIIARPAFADHSFEELRVAFLLSGKELNSAEIRQQLNLPPPSVPTTMAPQVVVTGPSLIPSPGPPLPPPPTLGPSLGAAFSAQQKAIPSFSFKF